MIVDYYTKFRIFAPALAIYTLSIIIVWYLVKSSSRRHWVYLFNDYVVSDSKKHAPFEVGLELPSLHGHDLRLGNCQAMRFAGRRGIRYEQRQRRAMLE